MKTTRLLLLLSLLFFSFGKAQLSAFINGKEVKPGATISADDLASLQVSFKKPKQITIYSGYTNLYVEFGDSKKILIDNWWLRKDGYTAMEDFLKNTPANKKFNVFEGEDFVTRGNTLQTMLDNAKGLEAQKNITLEIGFIAREETGYKEYGPKVQLLEPLFFNVPVWNDKNLFLPFLDVSIDKTNIKENIGLIHAGTPGYGDYETGYKVFNGISYKIFAFEKSAYQGLSVDELAKDFIYKATYGSNWDKVKSNHQYDTNKYKFPWRNINNLFDYDYKIQDLSYNENKELKSKDLMSLYQKVEFGKMKGYSFQANIFEFKDQKRIPNVGQFKIYILNHPTNPDLILMICNEIQSNKATIQDLDTFIQTFLKSIKQ